MGYVHTILRDARTQFKMGSLGAYAWKDIWGCGQGIGAISQVQSTADFVAQLKREYAAARARLLGLV